MAELGADRDLDVLLVDDDREFARSIVGGLQRYGMRVHHVITGREALHAGPGSDVVLLDLELPDREGVEVCRQLRTRSAVPILVMSGRAEERDRVEALDLGADDYLVKPVGLRELVSRIHAVRRRSVGQGQLVLSAGALQLDRRRREVRVGERRVRLASKEFDLLAFLMEEPDTVRPRRQILDEVWEGEWHGTGRTLDMHVAALRKKLGDPGWIVTVRGVGFRLARSPENP